MQEPKLEEISLRYLDEGKVAIVALNRPKKYNAIRWENFFEIKQVMDYLQRQGSEVRAIILTGIGKHFTAGIDLNSAMDLQKLKDGEDPARNAMAILNMGGPLQDALSSLSTVRVPVIAAVHGLCIGAGVDLVSACDIRICEKASKFTIKELEIGMATDIGTL
jgi:enoyl-CoA hydratase